MNVYEAYLAITSDDKIIKASIKKSVFFVFQTIELPLMLKGISHIELSNAEDAMNKPKRMEDLQEFASSLDSVCIRWFSKDTLFEIISSEQMLAEIQAQWEENNKE